MEATKMVRESDIRKQMRANQFMDERSVQAGESGERAFERCARPKFELKPASRHDQTVKHIDYWASPKGWRPNLDKGESISSKPWYGIEVKAMKRISRKSPRPQSKWLWVEFKNINGGLGWLYGQATFLAAEVQDGFYLLNLKSLRSWCEVHVDREAKVTEPGKAQYKSYTRRNREDEMSLVELQAYVDWYEEATGRKCLFLPKEQ
jgi:hypothetical protein